MTPNRLADRPNAAGVRLHQARARLGFTQQRLAAAVVERARVAGEDLTLNASAISRWESGEFLPAVRYRPFLASVLGLDLQELFPPEF